MPSTSFAPMTASCWRCRRPRGIVHSGSASRRPKKFRAIVNAAISASFPARQHGRPNDGVIGGLVNLACSIHQETVGNDQRCRPGWWDVGPPRRNWPRRPIWRDLAKPPVTLENDVGRKAPFARAGRACAKRAATFEGDGPRTKCHAGPRRAPTEWKTCFSCRYLDR